MTTREITEKIKEDYVTVVNFCRKNGINKHTFYVVMGGHSRSRAITEVLLSHGYITSEEDMPKPSNQLAKLDAQIARVEAQLAQLRTRRREVARS